MTESKTTSADEIVLRKALDFLPTHKAYGEIVVTRKKALAALERLLKKAKQ